MTTTERAVYAEIKKIPKEQLGEFLKIAKSFNSQVKSKTKEPDTMSGLFEDCPELLDEIVEDAMKDREKMPFRTQA